MSIPLVRFEGFLKQMRRDFLGSAAQLVLDTAFPFFWPADPDSESFRQQERVFREAGVDYIWADTAAPRRLAGCWTLPKGRYFSLCLDDTGNDDNTLVNELTAYLDPLRGGLLLFGDTIYSNAFEFFQKQGFSFSPGNYLLCVIVGRPGAISPIIDTLGSLGFTNKHIKQREDRVLVAVEMPYRVHFQQIEDVCDLRLPECQEHVVKEFFEKDTPQLTKTDRSGIDRFVESLPLLMHPALGGGPQANSNGSILQALAAFLRTQGANALIFPSARSDVLAEIRYRRLNRWRGWCLVDYRGAQEPLVSACHDFSAGWEKNFPSGA